MFSLEREHTHMTTSLQHRDASRPTWVSRWNTRGPYRKRGAALARVSGTQCNQSRCAGVLMGRWLRQLASLTVSMGASTKEEYRGVCGENVRQQVGTSDLGNRDACNVPVLVKKAASADTTGPRLLHMPYGRSVLATGVPRA